MRVMVCNNFFVQFWLEFFLKICVTEINHSFEKQITLLRHIWCIFFTVAVKLELKITVNCNFIRQYFNSPFITLELWCLWNNTESLAPYNLNKDNFSENAFLCSWVVAKTFYFRYNLILYLFSRETISGCFQKQSSAGAE